MIKLVPLLYVVGSNITGGGVLSSRSFCFFKLVKCKPCGPFNDTGRGATRYNPSPQVRSLRSRSDASLCLSGPDLVYRDRGL